MIETQDIASPPQDIASPRDAFRLHHTIKSDLSQKRVKT